jgi:hypothetical protein
LSVVSWPENSIVLPSLKPSSHTVTQTLRSNSVIGRRGTSDGRDQVIE